MKITRILFVFLLTVLLFDFSFAQDWANLQKFQRENAELPATKEGENRIVFMGNSITIGWIKTHPEFFAGKSYVNRGISGQTTPQMLLRFRQDVLNLNPAAVVILAGINDIAENTGPSTIQMIADNIFSMAELAKINNIKVVLCSVLPAIDFPWRHGLEPAEKVIKLNDTIKSYAENNGFEYVDYYSSMVNESKGLKDDLGTDGVHPNFNGYLIMETLLEKRLTKMKLIP